jgi:hypothetical protein
MAEIDNKILNGVSNRPLNMLQESSAIGNDKIKSGLYWGEGCCQG